MCHSRRHPESLERRPVIEPDSSLRTSDADREETVTRLRRHAAAGRLDVDELEQRIGAAYAARTHGELAALQADLPRIELARPRRERHDRAPEWIVYAQVNALLVAIWAVSGAGYFWPAWVIAWWGLAIVLKSAPGLLRLR